MQFVEGHLYITTESVSMRPHGYVPEGTIVRVVEVISRDHVAFEFVNGTPAELDYAGDWVPASQLLATLVPYGEPVSRAQPLSRVAAVGRCWLKIAACALLAFTCLSELTEVFGSKVTPDIAHAEHNSGTQPYAWRARLASVDLPQQSVCVWTWSADYFPQCKHKVGMAMDN